MSSRPRAFGSRREIFENMSLASTQTHRRQQQQQPQADGGAMRAPLMDRPSATPNALAGNGAPADELTLSDDYQESNVMDARLNDEEGDDYTIDQYGNKKPRNTLDRMLYLPCRGFHPKEALAEANGHITLAPLTTTRNMQQSVCRRSYPLADYLGMGAAEDLNPDTTLKGTGYKLRGTAVVPSSITVTGHCRVPCSVIVSMRNEETGKKEIYRTHLSTDTNDSALECCDDCDGADGAAAPKETLQQATMVLTGPTPTTKHIQLTDADCIFKAGHILGYRSPDADVKHPDDEMILVNSQDSLYDQLKDDMVEHEELDIRESTYGSKYLMVPRSHYTRRKNQYEEFHQNGYDPENKVRKGATHMDIEVRSNSGGPLFKMSKEAKTMGDQLKALNARIENGDVSQMERTVENRDRLQASLQEKLAEDSFTPFTLELNVQGVGNFSVPPSARKVTTASKIVMHALATPPIFNNKLISERVTEKQMELMDAGQDFPKIQNAFEKFPDSKLYESYSKDMQQQRRKGAI